MDIENSQVKQQLRAIEQVAQKPTRVLSSETLQLAKTQIAEGLKTISIPNSIYYSDRCNGEFSLDLKPHTSLTDQEKDEICNLMNHYSYDPSLPPEQLSKRGFLGSPGSTKKAPLIRDQLMIPPMRSDWLLVKHRGKVIAFMNVNPFDKTLLMS